MISKSAAGKGVTMGAMTALLLALFMGVDAVAAEERTVNAPTVRWRGFNLDGKAIKGAFSGEWREDDLALMHEFGFNFVRVMVDYRYFCRPGTFEPDPALFPPIDEVIGWGRKYALHVQICFSIPPGVDYSISRSKKAMLVEPEVVAGNVACWRFFAHRYRDIPGDQLSFNLFNEPSADCPEPAYVAFIKACEQAIHAESPARLVIADGTQTARRPILGALDLPIGQSHHIYDPMGISHYRAPWCKGAFDAATPVWPPVPVTSPLYGSRKRDIQDPIVLLDVPACQLTVQPGLVNRLAELVVRADGREVGRTRYQPAENSPGYSNLVARSNQEWAGVPLRPFAVDVPVCTRLEIALDQGDWMEVRELAFAAQDSCVRLEPLYQWRTAGVPRTTVRFAGFDAESPFRLENGQPFTGVDHLRQQVFAAWEPVYKAGQFVMVGETGVYNQTPHDVALAWLESVLKELKDRNVGWAIWNFRGAFGILDSGRKDVQYEDFRGHKLDRKMLELLQRY